MICSHHVNNNLCNVMAVCYSLPVFIACLSLKILHFQFIIRIETLGLIHFIIFFILI